MGLTPSAQRPQHDMPSTKWTEAVAHDSDKERTETAEDTDEQALLALVVTK